MLLIIIIFVTSVNCCQLWQITEGHKSKSTWFRWGVLSASCKRETEWPLCTKCGMLWYISPFSSLVTDSDRACYPHNGINLIVPCYCWSSHETFCSLIANMWTGWMDWFGKEERCHIAYVGRSPQTAINHNHQIAYVWFESTSPCNVARCSTIELIGL